MSFGPCADHNPAPPYNRTPRRKGEACATCKRIEIEGKIAHKAVNVLLAKGYELSVHDSEEFTVKRSRDAAEIKAAMFTSDDDRLFAYRPGDEDRFGWVWFVYGNSGPDVICDYTVSLTDDLKEVNDYAERFDRA
jgi:hypothetical protein